jgi:hypothetical protein
MSFQHSNRGLSDEDLKELENEKKELEKQEANRILNKINELESSKNVVELDKIVNEAKKSGFFKCRSGEDPSPGETEIAQVKRCMGYFINPDSRSAYSDLNYADTAYLMLGSFYKSVMKLANRPPTPPTPVQGGKGGKRSRKYKRKSIKKLRKKSHRYIKKK